MKFKCHYSSLLMISVGILFSHFVMSNNGANAFVFPTPTRGQVYKSYGEIEQDFHIKLRRTTTMYEVRNANGADDSSIPPPVNTFSELAESYFHMGEIVDMTQRRFSSYKGPGGRGRINLGVEVPPEHTANGMPFTPLPVEMRGITLRQLRAVYANAVRRCVDETWLNRERQPITPESVNLYDIDKYIIKPFTELTQKSFVETLPSTAGTQPPRFFISHWWGEPFCHTLDCIETMAEDFCNNLTNEDDTRGGGMTEDTPIWICAFANNQWALDGDITTDPKESSFTRAMMVACYRTLTILDNKGQVFFRIWCMFELYLTLVMAKKDDSINGGGIWAVYTALEGSKERPAVGIVSGGAPGEDSFLTSERERRFPAKLILLSDNIHVQSAKASKELDRVHILNSIASNSDLSTVPPISHPNFIKMEHAVKGEFAASMPAFVAARVAGEKWWKKMLVALSNGVRMGTFQLDFESFKTRLSSLEAKELVSHLPVTCTGLGIRDASGSDGEGAINGMIEWVEKANSIQVLDCISCKVGNATKGREAGSRLAAAMALKHAKSVEKIEVYDTDLIDAGNLLDWALALQKMTNLKELAFIDVDLSNKEKDILHNATSAPEVYF